MARPVPGAGFDAKRSERRQALCASSTRTASRPSTSQVLASTISASRAGQHRTVLPYTDCDARTTSQREVVTLRSSEHHRAAAVRFIFPRAAGPSR